VGRLNVFRREDLLAFLENNKVKTALELEEQAEERLKEMKVKLKWEGMSWE
jgi:hypothetical protein